MHIVVSWDISATGSRWTEIDDQLKAQLEGFSWVRPLKTVYVVKVHSVSHRDELINNLQNVAKNTSETLHFLASPPMTGGSYNGWLPQDLWDKIRERAN